MALSRLRLEGLGEWQALVSRLEERKLALMEYAIRAKEIEKVRYYEGQVDMIDEVISLPKEIFRDE